MRKTEKHLKKFLVFANNYLMWIGSWNFYSVSTISVYNVWYSILSPLFLIFNYHFSLCKKHVVIDSQQELSSVMKSTLNMRNTKLRRMWCRCLSHILFWIYISLTDLHYLTNVFINRCLVILFLFFFFGVVLCSALSKWWSGEPTVVISNSEWMNTIHWFWVPLHVYGDEQPKLM